MFFATCKTETGMEISIPIKTDNVFTRCPGCGRHIPVNLETLLTDGISNLADTRLYCCGKAVSVCQPLRKGGPNE